MAMAKAKLENKIREKVLADLKEWIASRGDDVLPISVNEIAFPSVDEEGNEKFVVLKVTIPRGTRANGTYEPFDGYARSREWLEETAPEE